ncbi:hypothetical protein H1S01_04075 [Heliobacterium chlorum]|uniref:4-vinyl reductase 4VR domain-containing protein n=1 Tax=Heliobacterium chlorum TaxID=2698 RepID=A0ABR7SYS7_HELCL|nr:4-vinyl reductase [Heliobacterium chlorum]MBC9783688.1 hypothetical protein [Heliobacterium chlorum]
MKMSTYKALEIDYKYDPKQARRKINGNTFVFHCHHYATLYTQLAIDAKDLADGPQLLTDAAEDSFRAWFDRYDADHPGMTLEEKADMGRQFYSWSGLGDMKIGCLGENGGEVYLHHSHLDSGWLKKFGRAEKPVNFITCGFIAALFSSLYNQPARSYRVVEEKSIACGDMQSLFIAVRV